MLHQVGVSFDLYYDARKHKFKTLRQVSQFTYLGCSISYRFFDDVEFKLTKSLQLNFWRRNYFFFILAHLYIKLE